MSGRRPFTARGARTATEADHAELGRRGRSASTVRAYRSDLADFTRFHPGPLTSVTPAVLRAYLATLAGKTLCLPKIHPCR